MANRLTTGGATDPFLPRLLAAIRRADQIDLAVAFVKSSGLALLFDTLLDAVEKRGSRLRVLTSDYLDVTDPAALRALMLLVERGADIRLFEADEQSFHLKAYICIQSEDRCEIWGAAFIGSSNITRTALTDGIEWNYQVEMVSGGPDGQSTQIAQDLAQIRTAFASLFRHRQVRRLDYDWIDAYEERRKVQRLPLDFLSVEREEPPAQPNDVQREALDALDATRRAGYQRGLVVMATGLGKTYLAAFDSVESQAHRVLFVAHREEILLQAEATFQRVHPHARVGRYTGGKKDINADLLFASVQTLGKSRHLAAFAPDRFDYIVVDEFHHAAAGTYRRLLKHFRPRFLLGLTATPERTDQSDILSLCDDNLVYSRSLFHGVQVGLLCPFHYYGIFDETVDYQEIPWRNGRFDPQSLSNKLATLRRARHALATWRERAQRRTLAFCVSISHAEFMAERFRLGGVRASAVYLDSKLLRSEALEQLARGELQVIFSVDLFNEGVDLPSIDTIMMLRPTESKVLFLQQLGRGLRRHDDKERLVVLDFIGNHKGFLNKLQALFEVGSTYQALSDFGRRARDDELTLPAGCYVNFDLTVIDFLIRLKGQGPAADYQALKDSLGRRPTLAEFYRSRSSVSDLRPQYGQWWKLVRDQGDLSLSETACLERHDAFLREVETTSMVRSFKAVLLESLLENDGFRNPPTVEDLATQALDVFRRRRSFIVDIKKDLQDLDDIVPGKWLTYWNGNPINAWVGGNKAGDAQRWFELRDGRFCTTFRVPREEIGTFQSMAQELVDYRLAAYEQRLPKSKTAEPAGARPAVERSAAEILPFRPRQPTATDSEEVPYFPDLRIACGHFRSGRTDVDATCRVAPGHGRIDPNLHFVARAIGDSMNGGKNPVQDGNYLLLERLDPAHAGSISGSTLVVERQDATGDDQYLLRVVVKTPDGRYVLKAANPNYPDYAADEGMRTLARLKAVLAETEVNFD